MGASMCIGYGSRIFFAPLLFQRAGMRYRQSCRHDSPFGEWGVKTPNRAPTRFKTSDVAPLRRGLRRAGVFAPVIQMSLCSPDLSKSGSAGRSDRERQDLLLASRRTGVLGQAHVLCQDVGDVGRDMAGRKAAVHR